MSRSLKCPNSGCPYLFDPTGVPAGVTLSCPRCGMRFTLSTPEPGQATPPKDPLQPPRPDPGFESLAKRPASEPDPRSTRDQMLLDRGNTSSHMMVFWTIFTIAILLGVGVTVYFKAFHTPDRAPSEIANKLKDCNLGFDPLGEQWSRDQDMESKLGSPIQIVFKRKDTDAYIAIGAVPNDDREPRLSELKEGLSKPLGKLWPLDDIRTEPLNGGITWLGQPANPVFSFTATAPDSTKSSGECYAVRYKGVAYWCICWAGELEFAKVAPEFDEVRHRFKILKERENWQPKQTPTTTYGGHAAKFILLDADGIWTEDNHPEQQLPPADLYLIGKIRRPGTDKFDRQPTAEVWAYVIDNPGGDPLQAGQKYAEGLRTAEVKGGGGRFTVGFDVITSDPEGDPPTDPVEQSSPIVRLKSTVKESRDQSRLIVVSALPLGTKLVVVRAQCDFIDRSFFETKLMQMAGSLRGS